MNTLAIPSNSVLDEGFNFLTNLSDNFMNTLTIPTLISSCYVDYISINGSLFFPMQYHKIKQRNILSLPNHKMYYVPPELLALKVSVLGVIGRLIVSFFNCFRFPIIFNQSIHVYFPLFEKKIFASGSVIKVKSTKSKPWCCPAI